MVAIIDTGASTGGPSPARRPPTAANQQQMLRAARLARPV